MRHKKSVHTIILLFIITAAVTLTTIFNMETTANKALTRHTAATLATTLIETRLTLAHLPADQVETMPSSSIDLTKILAERMSNLHKDTAISFYEGKSIQGLPDGIISQLRLNDFSTQLISNPITGDDAVVHYQAITVDKNCISCHSSQTNNNWHVGDIISVLKISQPVRSDNAMTPVIRTAYYAFGALGILGLVSFLITGRRLQWVHDELVKSDEHKEDLKQLVEKDALTNIANRRAFEDQLSKLWQLAGQHQSPLSLIVFDLDHFKNINDNYGHQAGDDCLKAVADTVDASLRSEKGDFFARYGGEEFAIILPDTNIEKTRFVAERVRMIIESIHLPGYDFKITASLGCACFIPEPGMPQSRLFEYADIALYAAKGQGRNRVVPH